MAYIQNTTIPVPTGRTPFSQVLPFGKVFDENLVNQLAYEQVAPDVLRNRNMALEDLGRGMALSGAYRTGKAPEEAQRLRDQYTRQINEQKAQFTGNVGDWLSNWYNRQSEAYYKNPTAFKMPTLPTFDQYMGSKGISQNYTKPESLQQLESGGWNPMGGYRSLGKTYAPPTPTRSDLWERYMTNTGLPGSAQNVSNLYSNTPSNLFSI